MPSRLLSGNAGDAVVFLRAACVRFRPIEMAKSIKCPYCFHDILISWEPLYRLDRSGNPHPKIEQTTDADLVKGVFVEVDWMCCFNDDCNQIIVRIRKGFYNPTTDGRYPETIEEWLAVPRKRALRAIDPLVPEQFSKPYIRASLILEDAPDMSGVLSRLIIADLLKKYASLDQYDLPTRIDKFAADIRHPSRLRNNLQYLREIGNFGAHTQADEEGNVIEIGADEAEWTLNVIDGLFDYFIVGPEKDRQRRAAFDEKIQKAGRKAVKKSGDST